MKRVDAVAEIIGPVPEQCSLRGLRLWETHSMRSKQGTFLEERRGDAQWPRAARELLRAALCWEPTERASMPCMLRTDFVRNSGGAPLMPAVTAATRSPSTTPRSRAIVATEECPHAADGSGDARTGEPAEAEDEESGLHTGCCQCRGNCGSRVHKKRANKVYRADGSGAICGATPGQGSRFCFRCECEHDGCKHGRLAGYVWRWCRKHYIQHTPGN